MKNFHYLVDEIYEFIDEIIGSIVPGLYFCSYSVFLILSFIFICKSDIISDNDRTPSLLILFLLIVAYVIGTMFRRSNSREPDSASARFIYYNSSPSDDNDFAFAKVLSSEEYTELVNAFIVLANKYSRIKYNYHLVAELEYKGGLIGTIKNLFRVKKAKIKYSPFIKVRIVIIEAVSRFKIATSFRAKG